MKDKKINKIFFFLFSLILSRRSISQHSVIVCFMSKKSILYNYTKWVKPFWQTVCRMRISNRCAHPCSQSKKNVSGPTRENIYICSLWVQPFKKIQNRIQIRKLWTSIRIQLEDKHRILSWGRDDFFKSRKTHILEVRNSRVLTLSF